MMLPVRIIRPTLRFGQLASILLLTLFTVQARAQEITFEDPIYDIRTIDLDEDFIRLKAPDMDQSRWIMRILDIQGKILSITELNQDGSGVHEIDTAILPTGIYIVALQSQDEIIVSKFMRQ